MRLVIIAPGKMKDGPERDLAERYLKRARAVGRSLGIRDVEVIELAESRARSSESRKREEAQKILAAIPPDSRLTALDERGAGQSSKKFARHIARNMEDGCPSMVFIIGGPDGLDGGILERCHSVLGLSPLTWPHQIVRVLLSEQIYRAMTILGGHPYHRS